MTSPPVAPGLSSPPPTATERWRRVPWRWRVVMVAVVAAVAVEYGVSVVSGLGGASNGATGPSSSFDSSASGTEALAQFLGDRGHRLVRLTTPLGGARLPSPSTVFVLDPTSWRASDTAALWRVVTDGGDVVLGGRPPAPGILRRLLGTAVAPRWLSAASGPAHPVGSSPLLDGVGTVDASGPGTYAVAPRESAAVTPLLRGATGDLALVARRGAGAVVLLGSSSPLRNGVLGRADNAAFALDLVPDHRAVVMDEYDHGFGRPGRGLAGLPVDWRLALILVLVAVVTWILSAARRFGPPDPADRITVPARVRYVEALATLLATRPAEEVVRAAEPVYGEARRRLCARLGVAPDSSDQVLADRLSVSATAGSTLDVAGRALRRPPASLDDLVAVGTALCFLAAHWPQSK